MSKKDIAPDGYEYIYVKWFRTKDGRKIVAANYGKQAFRIKVKAS